MNLIMHSRMAASVNAFDFKAAILARHAQHPVIVHFPIALFIASAVFEVLAAMLVCGAGAISLCRPLATEQSRLNAPSFAPGRGREMAD